jgi:hypothetical protein
LYPDTDLQRARYVNGAFDLSILADLDWILAV